MAKYNVRIKTSAVKEIEAIPTKRERQRIVRRISGLDDNPRPPGCQKLAGGVNRYRVRQGRYRIVYSIEDGQLIVEVVQVGHPKDIYR